jgi:DHA1 family bicyclomycin/chloramphenicol resistance-like MFS transporter
VDWPNFDLLKFICNDEGYVQKTMIYKDGFSPSSLEEISWSQCSSIFGESLPATGRQPLHPAQVARNYARLMTNRTFVVYSLIHALNFACIFSFASSSPLILMERMHVTPSAYTVIFATIATGTILGSFTSGILSRRQRPLRGMITFGLLLMVIA